MHSVKLSFDLYITVISHNGFFKQIKDLTQITEVMLFIEEVYLSLLHHPIFWKIQLTQLTLQLLCLCEVSLNISGECSSLMHLLERGVELLKEVRIARNFNVSVTTWSFSSCSYSFTYTKGVLF